MPPIIIFTKTVQLNTNIQSISRESVTHVSQQGASVGAQSSCWAEWLSPGAECCLPLHLGHFHPIIIWPLPRLPLQNKWFDSWVYSNMILKKYLYSASFLYQKLFLFVFGQKSEPDNSYPFNLIIALPSLKLEFWNLSWENSVSIIIFWKKPAYY